MTTGELVVDRGYTTVGDITWSYDSTYTRFSGSISDIITGIGTRCTPFICSAYQSIDDGRALGSVPDGSIYGAGSTTNVYIKDTRYTASATFISEMGDVQIVYPLATPLTYGLTPTEVTALLGENTIWMDASGTIDVTYEDVVSPIKYAEVGELGTAAVRNANNKVVSDDTLPTGNAVYNHTANRTFFGTCSTAAAISAKVITLSDADDFKLVPGVVIGVKSTVTNTASNVTLNVNGTGAKSVWYNTAVHTGSTAGLYGTANLVIYYMYDGEHWVFLNNSSNYANNSNTVPAAQCETAAATAAKAATITNYTLTANTYLHFNIRYANTVAGAITMNVNSKGAKPIYINGSASSSSNHTLPAGSYIAFYNGTNWYFRTDGTLPKASFGIERVVRDANTLYGVNSLHVAEYAGTSDNLPETGGYFHIYTSQGPDSKYAVQLALAHSSNYAFYRSYVNGTWKPWVSLINTDTTDLTLMTGTLTAAHGGTGQTSLQATRNAMGLGNTTGALPIANGGTGATTAAAALNNLGIGHIEKKLVTVEVSNSNTSNAVSITWDTAFSSVDNYVVVATQNVGTTIFNGAVAEVNTKSTTGCSVRLVRPSSTMNGSSKISVIAMEI